MKILNPFNYYLNKNKYLEYRGAQGHKELETRSMFNEISTFSRFEFFFPHNRFRFCLKCFRIN